MDIHIACEQFCEYSVSFLGFSKDTIRRYRFVIKSYSKIASISTVAEASEENVRAMFLYGRGKRNWSVNTFLVYKKSLSVFFKWCIKQGYLTINPAKEIEPPKLEKRAPVGLFEHRALRLLDVVQNYPYSNPFLRYRNHAIFSMFLFAGLRKQELLNLRLNDVDIENFTIFVRQGKGHKDRILPMSYTLAQSLKCYIAARNKVHKTNPEFFSSYTHNIGFTESGLKRLILQMCDASGIKFTPHILRHTFATLMLEGGCEIFSLSKMMGHTNIQTTTIYLSAAPKLLRSQMTKHPLNSLQAQPIRPEPV